MGIKDRHSAFENLENLQEEAVLSMLLAIVEDARRRGKSVCNCDRCLIDMAALALNSLPPRYVADRFNIFPTNKPQNMQHKEKVLAAVLEAIDKVGSKPRHA